MENKVLKKGIVVIILIVIGLSVISNAGGNNFNTNITEIQSDRTLQTLTTAPEVWVDDDYYEGGGNDGHVWGYDAFDNIQDGIDSVTDFGIIHVKEGIYDVFIIEGRNALDIIGEDDPIITGNQLAYDLSYSAKVYNVVFVNNSHDVNMEGVHVTGTDPTPTGRDFTVFFQNSNGELHNCTIDANSIQNMNAIAVRAIYDSSLTISQCIIKDYGRLAIYAKTGTILTVTNSSLIGQVYNQTQWVSYGIEIEGIDDPCLGIITDNEIYNHDNTLSSAWSSAGIIIDAWRYYGPSYNCKNSTVLIRNNKIYDNMHGVQIVPNDNIVLTYNEIQGNHVGAISDPWFDGSTYHPADLQAKSNWWGDASGPYHPDENPDGQGDEITDDVLFDPWLTEIAADLSCSGSLHWTNVAPGALVTGSFTVKNIGYVYSELSWEVDEKPTWGEWTLDPENGIISGLGSMTVQVSVIAPKNKNRNFTGSLKIINTEDPSDYCEIDIYLKTPTSASSHYNIQFFEWLFERYPHAFPLLRRLLGY